LESIVADGIDRARHRAIDAPSSASIAVACLPVARSIPSNTTS